MNFIVAALYRFHPIPDPTSLRSRLLAVARSGDVKGTLLLAAEGINGTVAGPRAGIDALVAAIRAENGLEALEYKEALSEDMPFRRLKIRLKKEIVTIGIPEIDAGAAAGTYVEGAEWNALVADPDTIVIDTRNAYEVALGTFRGAADPGTQSFHEFPGWVQKNLGNRKHRKVAMFCTGGIRCEKASAYMKSAGFDQVYHLKGGILKYLETVPEAESLWQGDCFVFDQRVAVTHGLQPCDYVSCPSCRLPVDAKGRASQAYVEGVCCAACAESLSPQKRAASAERHRQENLARLRGEKHIGAEYLSSPSPPTREARAGGEGEEGRAS